MYHATPSDNPQTPKRKRLINSRADRDDEDEYFIKRGNIKHRDLDGDHYFISREIADSEAESRSAGEIGEALSDIKGFSADDVPQWDGEE